MSSHIPQSSSGPVRQEALHRQLAFFNKARLQPATVTDDWPQRLRAELEGVLVEGQMVEEERAAVMAQAAQAPAQVDAFIAWFEALAATGPGQHDPLFPWLAETADWDQMRWFLRQEAAGEAGFDDLVALTQVKMPDVPKLELANNYWDEMGRGQLAGMHGLLLARLTERVGGQPSIEDTVWPSLALSNLMTAFACNRRYAYESIGALGVVELTAPGRVSLVAAGLKRLGLSARERAYFDLHAVLDKKHSAAWNALVIRPLVEARPDCARAIAVGALVRLRAGARCFAHYRAHLNPDYQAAA